MQMQTLMTYDLWEKYALFGRFLCLLWWNPKRYDIISHFGAMTLESFDCVREGWEIHSQN